MQSNQKALIVRTGPEGHDGLEELNIELGRGWTVAEVAPMGGAGGATSSPVVAALVILERQDEEEAPDLAVETVEQVEEDADEVVEEVVDEVVDSVDKGVEGDGTNPPPERP